MMFGAGGNNHHLQAHTHTHSMHISKLIHIIEALKRFMATTTILRDPGRAC